MMFRHKTNVRRVTTISILLLVAALLLLSIALVDAGTHCTKYDNYGNCVIGNQIDLGWEVITQTPQNTPAPTATP